jgi:KaiC/GvpD/RAD55 family RecA-like ATPase
MGMPDDSSFTEEEAIIFWRNFENPWLQDPYKTQYPKIEPKYFKDSEGQFVFVPGSIHWLYGKPGTMKSFLAITACVESNGIYIDFENGEKKMSNRVQEMGYFNKSGIRPGFYYPESYQDLQNKIKEIKKMSPTVVVIDAFSMLAAMGNLNIESNADVVKLISEVINPLKIAGHAVIVIDHVTKNGSNHDYPIGSESKKAQSDVLHRVEYDSKTRKLQIFVCKDRDNVYEGRTFDKSGSNGEIRLYGTLELDPITTRAIIQRVNIEETRANWKKTSPININKQKIMELGDELSLLSQRDLQQKIGGKEELLRAAKNQLLNDGYLEKKSRKGPNGGTISVLAYTEKVWSPDLEDC